MMKKLGIRQKILLLVLALNVALTAILSVMMYRNERAAILRGIDEKLYAGATAIAEMFPDGYHAGIAGPDSVSAAEYQANVRRLTDLARKNNFVYLYTYMEQGGQIVTTSTSANLKDGSIVPFLAPYQQPSEKLRRAFAERQPFFDEYTDEFCNCRSAFVPIVTSNGRVFVAGSDVSIEFIGDILNQNLRKLMLISALVSAFFVLLSVVVANRLARPIDELSSVTKSLGQTASLTEEHERWLQAVASERGDEVGELASAFIHMDATLKQYLANLRVTTAAKERIESELNIARSIQDSFLHKLFPPFPDRKDVDLYAALEPAKEVGGDLYDFLLIGDELYFCVGDVSDKGVPAALLMVVTQTLMRAAAQQLPGMDPAAMLIKVNADIFEKNETLMFVTMFCGVLNIRTGALRFSNAGHNPPLIRRRDGSVEWLKLPPGMVLGVMPEQPYTTSSTTLHPGDTLLAYTDGVTEAKSPQSKLFSDKTLKETVEAHPQGTPKELVGVVMTSVKAHASTAPQSDDITVLALSLAHP